ncbi:MAG: class I SAM-dependent methyltransferase [Chloroflexi bacterium]|nr:class I SAM-dependent methyltransferase [Chloroflexota bacterium]
MTLARQPLRLGELQQAYERIWASGGLYEDPGYYRWILSLLQPQRGQRLLDVACGGGWLLAEAAKQGLEAHGVELSTLAIRQAANAAPLARLAQADAESLPYSDETFDYATCLGSLEHFLNPPQALRELRRVLRRSGTVCIVVPNQWFVLDVIRGWIEGHGLSHEQELERFYGLTEAKAMIIQKGQLFPFVAVGYNPPPAVIAKTKALSRFKRLYLALYRFLRGRLPVATSYVFVFLCSREPRGVPSSLQMHRLEDKIYLLEGWHQREESGVPFRWTTREASAYVGVRPGSRRLHILAANMDPRATTEPLSVAIVADAEPPVDHLLADTAWRELSQPLPLDAVERGFVKVTITVARTWSPLQILGSDDQRDLGLAVQRIWNA